MQVTSLILTILLFFFISCEKNKGTSVLEKYSNQVSLSEPESPLNTNEYVEWVENNLKSEKKIGDLSFTAVYKPYPYIASIELSKDNITAAELKKKTEEIDGLQYFTFRISSEIESQELLKIGLKDENEYYPRLEYFSFQMQNDITLIDGEAVLFCRLFHFERVYGIAPYATFVLGFPLNDKTSAASNKTLVYDDKIFNVGKINLTIKGSDIERTPELITI